MLSTSYPTLLLIRLTKEGEQLFSLAEITDERHRSAGGEKSGVGTMSAPRSWTRSYGRTKKRFCNCITIFHLSRDTRDFRNKSLLWAGLEYVSRRDGPVSVLMVLLIHSEPMEEICAMCVCVDILRAEPEYGLNGVSLPLVEMTGII